MESVRQQKVSRLLQRELGMMFQKSLTHLAPGRMISVTVVRITPDLSFARIYVSVYPDSNPAETVSSFNDHLPEVQHLLYPRIRNQFRKMPEIRFYYDDSLDYADRINQILKD